MGISNKDIHYKNVLCMFLYKKSLYKESVASRCRFDCVAIFVAIGQKSKINSNDVYNRSCISNELVHVLLFFYILWGRHLCQLGQVIHNLTVYSNLPFSLLKYISRYLCLIYVSPMLIQHYNLIYILKWFDWCISLFMRIHRSTMFIRSHTQYESKYIIHDCIRRSSN